MKKDEVKRLPVLVISQQFMSEATCLHALVGDTEFSGILLYSVTSGSIKDTEKLELKAEHIWLMDIGSSAYTEFDYDSSVIDMMEEIDGAENLKFGLIHSHHRMSSDMSITDIDEMKENSATFNYYLSLVVNFAASYTAKIAVPFSYRGIEMLDEKGNKYVRDDDAKGCELINCRIMYEGEGWLIKRQTDVKLAIAQKEKKKKEEAARKPLNQVSNQSMMDWEWNPATGEWDSNPLPGLNDVNVEYDFDEQILHAIVEYSGHSHFYALCLGMDVFLENFEDVDEAAYNIASYVYGALDLTNEKDSDAMFDSMNTMFTRYKHNKDVSPFINSLKETKEWFFEHYQKLETENA